MATIRLVTRLVPANDGADLDPVGTALRQISQGVQQLQKIDPTRLSGDGALIASAILGLKIVQGRIDQVRREASDCDRLFQLTAE